MGSGCGSFGRVVASDTKKRAVWGPFIKKNKMQFAYLEQKGFCFLSNGETAVTTVACDVVLPT